MDLLAIVEFIDMYIEMQNNEKTEWRENTIQ